MSSILQSLYAIVLLYRYAAIFGIEAIGTFGVPVPSGAVLLSSFVFASQGVLNPYLVGLVAWVGTVVGDVAGFWIARKYGKVVLRKIGLRRLLDVSSFAKFEHRIERAPNITVILSRIVTTLAPVVNIVAGLSQMNLRTFIIADVIGQLVTILLNAFYGSVIGDNWTTIVNITGKLGILVGLIVLLIIIHNRGIFARLSHHFKK